MIHGSQERSILPSKYDKSLYQPENGHFKMKFVKENSIYSQWMRVKVQILHQKFKFSCEKVFIGGIPVTINKILSINYLLEVEW